MGFGGQVAGGVSGTEHESRPSPEAAARSNREWLVQQLAELDEATDRLCEALLRLRRSNAELSALVVRNESAREAIGDAEVPQRRRRELTSLLDEFEAARHQFRLALFAQCLEEGASVAEVGRALGISRQLASRLVSEAQLKARAASPRPEPGSRAR